MCRFYSVSQILIDKGAQSLFVFSYLVIPKKKRRQSNNYSSNYTSSATIAQKGGFQDFQDRPGKEKKGKEKKGEWKNPVFINSGGASFPPPEHAVDAGRQAGESAMAATAGAGLAPRRMRRHLPSCIAALADSWRAFLVQVSSGGYASDTWLLHMIRAVLRGTTSGCLSYFIVSYQLSWHISWSYYVLCTRTA